MRRDSPECLRLTRHRPSDLAVLDGFDPEPIIEQLEPLVTSRRQQRITDVLDRRLNAVTVVLDALHDPHNGAAIIRSCDAFGIWRVHVVERSEAFVVSSAVAKGCQRWVDTIAYDDAASAAATLRDDGYTLVGTHPQGETLPAQLSRIPRVALVMGNEHEGIHPDLAAACCQFVRVPMRGFVESLNVSVTAAILLCFATAERSGDLSGLQHRRLYARALMHSVPRALQVLTARGIEHVPPQRLEPEDAAAR